MGSEQHLAQWETMAAAVLRKSRRLADDAPDSDVWDKLTSLTLDDIAVVPLGIAEHLEGIEPTGVPGEAPYTRGAGLRDETLGGWDIRGWFTDPATDAETVEHELVYGANSLWFTLGEGAIDPAKLAELLEPVFLELAPVVLDAPDDPKAAIDALDAVYDDKASGAHRDSNLGVDPLGNMLRGNGSTDFDVLTHAVRVAQKHQIRAMVVDASVVHDLGGSDVTELAWSMFAAVTYLRALESEGVAPAEAAKLIEFRYAVTDRQFESLAKLRAARALWNRVGEHIGLDADARAQRQHVVTSRPMMARYDTYVNMLRTTVAGFAAGVGGADAVTVLPFDEPLGLPTPFSRRIARNTSLLLIHESHVAKVTDPAGGAYAIEKLTNDIAAAAWDVFTTLDGAATTSEAIALIGSAVDATIEKRRALVNQRKLPITGVSEFPNLTETLPERSPNTSPRYADVVRYAGEFEALRDEPAAQPVFLATMGPVAQHTARATFITNLFAAGGIHVSAGAASAGVEDVLEAYAEAGSPAVVCLAGTDAAYQDWGADLVTALRNNGASHVIIAGKSDLGDDAAAVGVDAYAFLTRTREVLK